MTTGMLIFVVDEPFDEPFSRMFQDLYLINDACKAKISVLFPSHIFMITHKHRNRDYMCNLCIINRKIIRISGT